MDYKISSVLDEIDVKVESLKMDLDNLRDKLKHEFLQAEDENKRFFVVNTFFLKAWIYIYVLFGKQAILSSPKIFYQVQGFLTGLIVINRINFFQSLPFQ